MLSNFCFQEMSHFPIKTFHGNDSNLKEKPKYPNNVETFVENPTRL